MRVKVPAEDDVRARVGLKDLVKPGPGHACVLDTGAFGGCAARTALPVVGEDEHGFTAHVNFRLHDGARRLHVVLANRFDGKAREDRAMNGFLFDIQDIAEHDLIAA